MEFFNLDERFFFKYVCNSLLLCVLVTSSTGGVTSIYVLGTLFAILASKTFILKVNHCSVLPFVKSHLMVTPRPWGV